MSGYFLPNAVVHGHPDSFNDPAPLFAIESSEIQDFANSITKSVAHVNQLGI